MTCQERKDLLLLYVSDALDPAEREEMRAHLATGCPTCAANLLESQSIWAMIPIALEFAPPPANLKQKVLDRIAAPPQRFPDTLPIRLFRILVPAAVAAGIAIVVTHAILSRQIRDLQKQADAAAVLLNFQDEKIKALQSGLAKQQDLVVMLRTPQTQRIELAGTDKQPGANACIIWDKKTEKWQFLCAGMKSAPPGKTYELWFVTKTGQKIPATIFDPKPNGEADLMVSVPSNLGPLALAAVTDEPVGGNPQPTGSFQLIGNIQ